MKIILLCLFLSVAPMLSGCSILSHTKSYSLNDPASVGCVAASDAKDHSDGDIFTIKTSSGPVDIGLIKMPTFSFIGPILIPVIPLPAFGGYGDFALHFNTRLDKAISLSLENWQINYDEENYAPIAIYDGSNKIENPKELKIPKGWSDVYIWFKKNDKAATKTVNDLVEVDLDLSALDASKSHLHYSFQKKSRWQYYPLALPDLTKPWPNHLTCNAEK